LYYPKRNKAKWGFYLLNDKELSIKDSLGKEEYRLQCIVCEQAKEGMKVKGNIAWSKKNGTKGLTQHAIVSHNDLHQKLVDTIEKKGSARKRKMERSRGLV
jgi:ubiquitin C-terminal hydrolase